MRQIIFVKGDGTRCNVTADDGESIMSAAVRNDISEIVAECGGACACGTCHCYIGEEWLHRLPPQSETEQAMIEFVVERKANSRLSCQIEIDESLDGIEVALPERQY